MAPGAKDKASLDRLIEEGEEMQADAENGSLPTLNRRFAFMTKAITELCALVRDLQDPELREIKEELDGIHKRHLAEDAKLSLLKVLCTVMFVLCGMLGSTLLALIGGLVWFFTHYPIPHVP